MRSARQLKAQNLVEDWVPRFNIAPTQSAPVALKEPALVLRRLPWGLRQSQTFCSSGLLINIRSETVAVKPRFKSLLQSQRCLVPADGFFEWLGQGRERLPVRFVLRDEAPFFMAGLWDWQTAAPGAPRHAAFTILTTEANDLVRRVHERMPVILNETQCEEWLNGDSSMRWDDFWEPYPAGEMNVYRVSPKVNSPSVDTPECVQALGPLPEELPGPTQAEFGF